MNERMNVPISMAHIPEPVPMSRIRFGEERGAK